MYSIRYSYMCQYIFVVLHTHIYVYIYIHILLLYHVKYFSFFYGKSLEIFETLNAIGPPGCMLTHMLISYLIKGAPWWDLIWIDNRGLVLTYFHLKAPNKNCCSIFLHFQGGSDSTNGQFVLQGWLKCPLLIVLWIHSPPRNAHKWRFIGIPK